MADGIEDLFQTATFTCNNENRSHWPSCGGFLLLACLATKHSIKFALHLLATPNHLCCHVTYKSSFKLIRVRSGIKMFPGVFVLGPAHLGMGVIREGENIQAHRFPKLLYVERLNGYQ
jgi:hypothetical protein